MSVFMSALTTGLSLVFGGVSKVGEVVIDGAGQIIGKASWK
jgi:hypothetical protein